METCSSGVRLADLLRALCPDLEVPGAEGIGLERVCIDSREATPGCLFAALRGERSDGHDYVAEAFRKGAAAALVERPVVGACVVDTRQTGLGPAVQPPVAVVVPDTMQALQRWAQARRTSRPDLKVVGVTGSVGKTTTKEAVASVLSARYRTLKSEGNQNNEIGLPLTLAVLEPVHRYAVLEMGMYALGEIAELCRIAQPQIGIVTNVEPVHLERLGSMDRIAQAKEELLQALPEDGVAILNGDDQRVRAMASRTLAKTITFGTTPECTVWADNVSSQGMEGVQFMAHVADLDLCDGGPAFCQLSTTTMGKQAVMSALPAVVVGLLERMNWDDIQRGLLGQGRGLRLVPKPGLRGTMLLDDTYNASPLATMAALDVLSEFPGRKLAVLGDMLELGSYEAEAHRDIGRHAAHVVDILVTVGPRARLIAAGAQEAGLNMRAIFATDNNRQATDILFNLLEEGDTLLLKGSRGMAMEGIVTALRSEVS
ncbi:MAG: UDP-N-acetylmuramoyl-tripeptide--D-alanyl-D-alanine ligase [Anaerolineae bacterium]